MKMWNRNTQSSRYWMDSSCIWSAWIEVRIMERTIWRSEWS